MNLDYDEIVNSIDEEYTSDELEITMATFTKLFKEYSKKEGTLISKDDSKKRKIIKELYIINNSIEKILK